MKQHRTTIQAAVLRFRRGAANVPLIIGGVVVAGLVAVGLWYAAGAAGGKVAPESTPVTAGNPAAEAAAQAAGEKNISTKDETGNAQQTAASQANGEKNLGN